MSEFMQEIERELAGWQPIETAPLIGNVLTYGPEGFAVAWTVDREVWIAGDSEDGQFEVDPTHWMPLPNSPESQPA